MRKSHNSKMKISSFRQSFTSSKRPMPKKNHIKLRHRPSSSLKSENSFQKYPNMKKSMINFIKGTLKISESRRGISRACVIGMSRMSGIIRGRWRSRRKHSEN